MNNDEIFLNNVENIVEYADAEEVSETGLVINDYARELLEQAGSFRELMMWYRCALREVQTKFEVLNEEFSLKYDRNPFETIKSRLKDPRSIYEKLRRKNLKPTVENIAHFVNDVAGIRVICSFPEDIYLLEQMLIVQDDIIVLKRKDYIKNPKASGYRSLHLIIDIPIFLSDQKKHMKVEVQFRTIAMDFWASLEHKLRYKKDIQNSVYIANELADCARKISEMDYRMQEIRHIIEQEDYL